MCSASPLRILSSRCAVVLAPALISLATSPVSDASAEVPARSLFRHACLHLANPRAFACALCASFLSSPLPAPRRRAPPLWLCSLLFCLGDHWCLMLLLFVVLVLTLLSRYCCLPVIPRAFAGYLCACLSSSLSVFPSCPSSCAPHLSYAHFCRWQIAIPIACVGLLEGLAPGALLQSGGVACPPWGRFFSFLPVLSILPRHRPTTCPPSILSLCACLVPVRILAL